jgi:lysophospholipase L1-like esterase
MSAPISTLTGAGVTTIAGAGVTTVSPPPSWLLLFGDSKTDLGHGPPPGTTWPPTLALAAGAGWFVSNGGATGATLATTLAALSTILAGMPLANEGGSLRVLINLGVNDMGSLPAEAAWEANYLSMIDAILAKWPTARVYLMRPWKQGFDALSATLHSWIDVIRAARAAAVFVGPDEAIWLKGSDNGVTNTPGDGIHYSAAGNAACVAQWMAVLFP